MEDHVCGEKWCSNCDCKVDKDHQCYMMPKNIKESSEKYIYFDFEATQDTGKHVVNFSVSKYHTLSAEDITDADIKHAYVKNCFNKWASKVLKRKFVKVSPEPSAARSIIHNNIDEFCEWLFTKEHTGYTVIAHNSKGYDCQFIMNYIYNKTTYKPFVIYAGSKIMSMSVKTPGMNLRFIDSLNFLTMPLSAFPKTFGLKELKKGYYPHYFNTEQNKNYVGPMPPKSDFSPNSMKTKDRSNFLKWYQDKVDLKYVWDNAKELKEYCISDVDILRRSMIEFRNLYLNIANIDPLQYTTIASVCMAIFKGHYLVDNYNTQYWEVKNSDDDNGEKLKAFNAKIREQVFKEGKISMMGLNDQTFVRKSFFGGRTNAISLLYNFEGTEEGHYKDITSLYPTVQYYDTYGLGHLKTEEFIFGDFNAQLDKYGFMDCTLWCPKDILFPVLPHKGKKLFFDLKDGDSIEKGKRGVWTTMELKKAVDMGYQIKKVHEFKYYERSSKDLFKKYVSCFLKVKQEASGYPDWVESEEDKDKYIDEYEKNQGIRLDKDKIVFNPGLRALAKLCLNNLWGRFGMRNNMPQTEITSDVERFNNIVFNDKKFTGQDFFFIDDNRVEIKFKHTEDHVKDNPSSNIGIASFTTSHARLRLYEGLDHLGEQVLYHDTDSIVYKHDPNNPNHQELKTGDYLGDWTDELEGKKMVGQFVAGGPKNYSYETDDNICHTKIKGFSLNYENSLTLNHVAMIDVVLNRGLSRDVNFKSLDLFNITRDKRNKVLKSQIITKRYKFGYDKRFICTPDANGNIMTLPWGHNEAI